MKTKLTLLALLISITSLAQNGINYKAIIKDVNGNIIANDLIEVQFAIFQGGTSVYEETHTPTTDSNGLVALNIGEGIAINGVFADIDWGSDNHYLNVQINTGSGLTNMGTTAFTAVPYAIEALNKEGLETLDEGNGFGWRLAGADADAHGNIGLNAVDLTNNDTSGNFGATGQSSVALGSRTTASGQNSTAMGFRTRANSYASTAIGRYNIGGGNPSDWIDGNPLFEIGNGTSNANRNNALTVFKDGMHVINSSGFGLFVETADIGLFVLNPSRSGILVSSAEEHGAILSGATSGVNAVSTNSSNPDVILGGNSSSDDNGILASDPDYASSDIFLRSNDAVVIALDNNNDEDGQFIIRSGGNNIVFEVDESGNISHDGTITSSSDRRLKKDISDLEYGLKEVLQLQPKQYFWKNQEQTKKSLGLIAQDVQPIINEIVNIQDDEMQTLGVSYTELIPVLINAIKEQQKIIESQGEALKTSNSSYRALLSRIEKLESNASN